MQTVRQFTDRLWYVTDICIIRKDHEPITYPTLTKFRKIALWTGNVSSLRSITAKEVNDRYVDSYGIIDNTLIIEVV